MATTKDTGVTVESGSVINDILPFCSQGVDGRDLLTQEAYATDVQRSIGHQPGIARQELANKQARQVSHMSAGLAQFLARRYAPGVKDDGDLDKVEAALVSVIMGLLESRLPGIATEEVNGICRPDGVTIKIDASGKISVVQADKYDLGEFYYFRHPTLKPGFAPLQGGLISGDYQGKHITEYPIWQYLQTAEGRLLLKTESEWQAMTRVIWHTNADGSTVGWNGIGGAPFYVQDMGAGTLRMADVRGMYAEAAGFDSLGVGGVHGDMIRNIVGTGISYRSTTAAWGAIEAIAGTDWNTGRAENNIYLYNSRLNIARVVPTGSSNKPRAWGALACCYLGQPA
ncbi:hypothetical protein NE637_08430 [Desulfovibrio desulfuricans]|uniref:hypothetical protein n=1 Tax=Desulfovibrio desulfuricans TaxID=876 RepID=UPI00210936ED|nr:hypothetical protein [Desulfovibrio desulfuricans]MCQ4861174.1 hypothetical protein [Desulfovibrio desulfuricans]